MSERPILFSAPMVRAYLDGLKTQTRRIVKDTDVRDVGAFGVAAYVTSRDVMERGRVIGHRDVTKTCPYGGPGDRLWAKETFVFRSKHERYYYRADHSVHDPYAHDGWRPSIFMPRKASRITLEITAVRLERLQEISEEDAIAEGVERNVDDGVTYWGPIGEGHVDPRVAYRWLWEDINGRGSWDANPWVWAISFPRCAP
jgi:hypothetical protein